MIALESMTNAVVYGHEPSSLLPSISNKTFRFELVEQALNPLYFGAKVRGLRYGVS